MAKQGKDWCTAFAHTYCTRYRKNDTDTSKPGVRHFSLPDHTHNNMTICSLSLHHRNTEKAVKILNISIIHFSARYTLSTPKQWMPLISFIYSQIHVSIIIIIIWKSTFQIPIQSEGGPPWKALLPKWSFLEKIVNYHTAINGKAPPHVDKNQQHPTIPLFTIFHYCP